MKHKLLAALMVGGLAAPAARADEAPENPTWVVPIHPAVLPATSREDMVGRDVPLPPVPGKATILHFWATWCVPCIAELPALDAFAAELAPLGVMTLAASEDRGGRSDVAPFLERRPLPAPITVLLDPHRSLARSLGVTVVPTTIVFGGDGQERTRLVGSGSWAGADKQRLLDAIKTAAAEKK